MNCQTCRHQLLVDPLSEAPELLAHLAGCPECAREAARALAFEAKLRDALTAEAAERGTPRAVPARGGNISVAPPWLARAAALLLVALGAGWGGYHWGYRAALSPDLGQLVLQHIDGEQQSLYRLSSVPPSELAHALGESAARLADDPGRITYLRRCVIRDRLGIHLVVAGERGPVTVLLMPGEHLPTPMRVDARSLAGIIVPTDYGSLAVVGEPSEPVEPLVERFRRVVVWDL